jgi:hypothetical protein
LLQLTIYRYVLFETILGLAAHRKLGSYWDILRASSAEFIAPFGFFVTNAKRGAVPV